MRTRWTTTRSRKEAPSRRRGGVLPRRDRPDPPPAPADPPEPARPARKELFDERRLRDAGGPEDRALYTCACGFAWEADVSASVACPNCGAAQAW